MMSSWYTLQLEAFRDALADRCLAIPGVKRGARSKQSGVLNMRLNVPANATWLVETLAREAGVPYELKPVERVRSELPQATHPVIRPWVFGLDDTPKYITQYQRDAVEWCTAREAGLIHMPPGGGKTLVGLLVALATGARRLYITRASIRRTFLRDIEKHSTLRPLLVEGVSPIDAAALDRASDVILGYSTLVAHVDQLLVWKPDVLVLDELHSLKSSKRWTAEHLANDRVVFHPKKNIAHAAMRLSRAAKRRYGLTATPIRDRVRDLWAQLDLLFPEAFGRSFYAFARRHCALHRNTWGGLDSTGAANLDELQQRLTFCMYHVPQDLMTRDLPPKRRQVLYLPVSDQNAPSGGFAKELREAKVPAHALEVRLAEAASKKRKVLVELVSDALAAGQKVAVFTARRRDVDALAKALAKGAGHATALLLATHGGDAPAARDEIREAFMAHAGPAVLIATGDSMGEGLNLNDADIIYFAGLPWTPGQVRQWEGRFHRMGQKKPVLIVFLVAEHTVDEHVASVLLEKLPPIGDTVKDEALDGIVADFRGDADAVVASALAKILSAESVADMDGIKV